MTSIDAAPLDPRAIEDRVRCADLGGVVTFLGVVRDSDERGRPVAALEYEAYEALANAEFATIAEQAERRFGRVRIAIAHRIGRVSPGEIAVVVCAAAVHRAAAFSACAFAIDAVKDRAPIWKREVYVDGSAAWKDNGARA